MRNLLLLIFAASLLGACTNTSDCFVDTDCGKGKICERDRCVTGSRGRTDDGDPPLDGDGVPIVGDPGLEPSDGIGPPNNLVGPEITELVPTEYQIVAGVILIRARVVDPDGLSETEPVLAIIGDYSVLELQSTGFDEFVGVFDTAELGLMQYPRLVVTAADFYGNRNSVGHAFTLDSFGPVVAFSSPEVQYYRTGETGLTECSDDFDPLGENEVEDRHVFEANPGDPFNGYTFAPRLRVQDRSNGSGGFYAGVEEVYLYLLDKTGIDTGQKLVVGTNGECSGINPALVPDPANPQPWQAIVQKMVPVTAWGQPDFTEDKATNLASRCASNGNSCTVANGCCSPEAAPCYEAPAQLCGWEPLTIWWTDAGRSPAVYVLNAYDAYNAALCAGGSFDTRNFHADGPVCLAAVAYDRVRNLGVSRPIAICVNRDGIGNECAGFDTGNDSAALCSDGCSAPDFSTYGNLLYWGE